MQSNGSWLIDTKGHVLESDWVKRTIKHLAVVLLNACAALTDNGGQGE
jgi:hypothetical protein